ncbi:MAG: DNA alkylation repair protein [Prevotellaceae bacterium]|jgi:3-methyladenine DNA glycosylase AlkD|nr:DNA alkylation repair protein [Prevotellaceae bacterium]
MITAQGIKEQLEQYADPVKRAFLPRFFKTGKGQYGEGDRFLGVVVPHTRTVAKQYKEAPLAVVDRLLADPYHECRLCGLLILVERYRKASPQEQETLVDFYLAHTSRINNWDLVDLSASYILGAYLTDKPRDVLYRLVKSDLLWEQRIAIVSTHALIRQGDPWDTLALAEQLLTTPHDLLQKATGWMLREVGKRQKELLVQFLDRHHRTMPRTMLRYAIEKMNQEERRHYMQR